ncbi:MAG: hypothetical protein QG593_8 [Patescibacteria group bacterium]|nr:hypothetical protein [Patescibacteria group bacterium]
MIEELKKRIDRIHLGGYRLCLNYFGEVLGNAGNMGVFCQSEEEYRDFSEERKKITKTSDNSDQKYFELIKPITYDKNSYNPEVIYTHLYIRRYDSEEPHIGDIDFYLEGAEYENLKNRLLNGEIISGVRIYDRQDLDMIELYDDSNDVLAYVSTREMTERARVKQSEETKL